MEEHATHAHLHTAHAIGGSCTACSPSAHAGCPRGLSCPHGGPRQTSAAPASLQRRMESESGPLHGPGAAALASDCWQTFARRCRCRCRCRLVQTTARPAEKQRCCALRGLLFLMSLWARAPAQPRTLSAQHRDAGPRGARAAAVAACAAGAATVDSKAHEKRVSYPAEGARGLRGGGDCGHAFARSHGGVAEQSHTREGEGAGAGRRVHAAHPRR